MSLQQTFAPTKKHSLIHSTKYLLFRLLDKAQYFSTSRRKPTYSELFSVENFLEKRYSTEKKKIQQLPHAFIYSHFDTQIRTNPTSSPNLLRNGGRNGEKKNPHTKRMRHRTQAAIRHHPTFRKPAPRTQKRHPAALQNKQNKGHCWDHFALQSLFFIYFLSV